VIDEGEKANLVLGNYSVAILKVEEKYEELAKGCRILLISKKY